MTKTNNKASLVRPALIKFSRLHFLYVAALAVQIIVYDAWDLIAPEAVLQRWIATALLLLAVTGIWYFAHTMRSAGFYSRLLFLLIVADTAFAGFAVYNQRGMASRAVMLFTIPLVVAAAFRSTRALFATAALCIATYVVTAVGYFVTHFNEGYKVELYGEVGFYCAIFLLIAGLLSALRSAHNT